jgi:hypothetical protein
MSSPPSRPAHPQLPPLQLPDDLKVEYANFVRIAHSPSDLVFDFAQVLPGANQAEVLARIVMSPLGAKLFYNALADNLARYESSFGAISIPTASPLADHLFRPPQPPQSPEDPSSPK